MLFRVIYPNNLKIEHSPYQSFRCFSWILTDRKLFSSFPLFIYHLPKYFTPPFLIPYQFNSILPFLKELLVNECFFFVVLYAKIIFSFPLLSDITKIFYERDKFFNFMKYISKYFFFALPEKVFYRIDFILFFIYAAFFFIYTAFFSIYITSDSIYFISFRI